MINILKLLKESLRIVLAFSAVFCLGMAILYPFMAGMKDCPSWLPYVIYPITVLIIAYMNLNPDKFKIEDES